MATWYHDRSINELKVDPEEAARRAGEMTRDRNRTPMQWSDNPNSGFSPAGVQTWLPVNPNYRDGINVKDQQHNPSSLLNYYKHLLRVRKHSPALVEGEYIPVHKTARDYFAFLRAVRPEQSGMQAVTETKGEQTILVILNFSDTKLELDFSRVREIKGHDLQILFSSAERLKTAKSPRGLTISPFEVFIAEVQQEK
jgi:glycosidase